MAAARREAAAAFGDGTIYVERLVCARAPRRGPAARRPARQPCRPRRARLLGPAPPPEARRGVAVARGRPTSMRAALFESARRVAGTRRLPQRGDGRVPRRRGRRPLLPRDEHAPPGRARRDRARDRARPRGMADPDRGGRARCHRERARAPRRGHAIEVRLYAEDPYDGFRPTAGRIGAWRMPTGPGVRVDAGDRGRHRAPTEYDPLLAKLMVHAEDRPAAVAPAAAGAGRDAGRWRSRPMPASMRWLVDEPGRSWMASTTPASSTGMGWSGRRQPPSELAAAAAAAIEARRGRSGGHPGRRFRDHGIGVGRGRPARGAATDERTRGARRRRAGRHGRWWRLELGRPRQRDRPRPAWRPEPRSSSSRDPGAPGWSPSRGGARRSTSPPGASESWPRPRPRPPGMTGRSSSRRPCPGWWWRSAVSAGDEVEAGRFAPDDRGDEDAERGPRAARGAG